MSVMKHYFPGDISLLASYLGLTLFGEARYLTPPKLEGKGQFIDMGSNFTSGVSTCRQSFFNIPI